MYAWFIAYTYPTSSHNAAGAIHHSDFRFDNEIVSAPFDAITNRTRIEFLERQIEVEHPDRPYAPTILTFQCLGPVE